MAPKKTTIKDDSVLETKLESKIDIEYRFGFADIEHKNIDDIEKMLAEYGIEKYIVAMEKVNNKTHVATNGEHIHFVLHIDKKTFKNFNETLKNRYTLSGKNGKTGRYCGWIDPKKVKDQQKFMAYSVKDDKVRWKGFSDDEIKNLLDESFQKQDTLIDELIKKIKMYRPEIRVGTMKEIDMTALELFIIKFHMEHDKRICRSQVKNLCLMYLQLHMIDRYDHLDVIYHYTMM